MMRGWRIGWRIGASIFISFVVVACSTTPPSPDRTDGAPIHPPRDLAQLPDPIPHNEPPSKYGNKSPYEVFGKTYYVMPNPENYREFGTASWYGTKFHGQSTSSGEPYDMYKLTAAHRTLPFETMVRVTNLSNGKSTTVRITDRGPFVENRIIDLSLAAAREIESVGPGVVPVRVEVLSPGVDPTTGFFTVQVGAFRDRGNAERLRERLNLSYSPIFIQQYDAPEGVFYRVRVGKISGEEAAHQFSERLRDRESFSPFVVRLDE